MTRPLAPKDAGSRQTCRVGSTAQQCNDPRAECLTPEGKCGSFFNLYLGKCYYPAEMCSYNGTVCGCNNYEYESDCAAYVLGVSVRNRGPCKTAPGSRPPPVPVTVPRTRDSICSDNSDCGDSEYCYTPDKQCSAYGRCVPRGLSPGCQEISGETPQGTFNPVARTPPRAVCGCDGQTYANECLASASGSSIAGYGVCDTVPADTPADEDGSCDDDNDCDDDEFCNFDKAACGDQPSLDGFCMKTPLFCPGIRGLERLAAAQSEVEARGLDVDGKLKGVGRAIGIGKDDGRGKAGGDNKGGLGGKIGQKPIGPSTRPFLRSVCGCDGQTYVSACAAHQARMSVRASGSCSSDPWDFRIA